MTQLDEAVTRYHKILHSDPHKDLAWAEPLRERMATEHLTVGNRLICPFLRPHFVTRRQFNSLVKATESLLSAIDRVKQVALATPALLARMELLPAEKMLASIDPGYPCLAVNSLLDTQLDNGSLHFVSASADNPTGVAYGEALADLFYDCPPMKEFRRRYALTKLGGKKHLVKALIKAYKQFGGQGTPKIAILELRPAYQSAEESEYVLLRNYLISEGYPTEIVTPEQLEYRGGVLRRGNFAIDLVCRRVGVHAFLLRFDLSHPLVRAYKDRAVCVVNSFRSELAHKRALFDLLTDDTVTAGFPAEERRVIREYIPWTRVVAAGKTTYHDQTIDLPEFIVKNRERLVLKPNDESVEQHSFRGWENTDAAWGKAVNAAMRSPYVVQEKVEPAQSIFPILTYGQLEMREMRVEVHPHAFLGKVQACSSWLSSVSGGGFSTIGGIAPTFIIENTK
jgi:hypothetical protein